MRVLCLTSEYPPRVGGVATHVAELAAALRRADVDIEVVAPPTEGSAAYDLSHADQRIVRYAPWLRAQPFYDFVLRRWCRQRVTQFRYDLLHVHGLRPLRSALATGLPVVFTNHTSGFLQTVAGGGRRLTKVKTLIRGASQIIAPSEELLSATRAAGYTGPGTYIPNGVDVARFCPGVDSGMRARWGLGATDVVVVIARRMVPKNGVLIAAHALSACTPTVKFVFVGDGPERVAIEAILSASGCRERAVFAGSMPNSTMPDVYRAADLCVLPSLMEATSIAGLEAMASGKTLIGSRVGGIPALIEDGISGVLVTPNDPVALALAINTTTRNRETLERMGKAARVRAEGRFAWEKIATLTRDVYRDVLAAGAST